MLKILTLCHTLPIFFPLTHLASDAIYALLLLYMFFRFLCNYIYYWFLFLSLLFCIKGLPHPTMIRLFIDIVLFKQRFYFFTFRERGRKGERVENSNVLEIHRSAGLVRPLLGTWPRTQACALTGNRTGDPLVHRLVLDPLSHTSQGYIVL